MAPDVAVAIGLHAACIARGFGTRDAEQIPPPPREGDDGSTDGWGSVRSKSSAVARGLQRGADPADRFARSGERGIRDP
jgi:hypothetical protein